MIPAMNAAQFKFPISAGTETKAFVTGELSWIISRRWKVDDIIVEECSIAKTVVGT
jgi:hypothetical protein